MLTEPVDNMLFHNQGVQREASHAARPGPITLIGRFMRQDKTEYPCRVKELTTERALLLTDAELEEGERIVAYVEDAGRLEGTVNPLPEPGQYELRLELSPAGRERLARKIEWIHSKERGEGVEKRRHERYRPRNSKSQILLEDGRRYDCEIIDISVSGASVRAPVLPAIGTPVMLGKTRGRVVRHHSEGFAIQFLRLLPAQTLRSKYI